MRGDQLVNDGQAGGAAIAARSPQTGRRVWMALMVAATIMVALVVRVGSDTDPFPVAIPGEAAALEASPLAMSGEPPHCGLKYAAVLDLAELGRSYGKESQTYRRAVDKVSGKANDCRIGARV